MGLSDFIHYYQAVFTPVIDWVQWPFRFMLKSSGLDIVIPQWVKDFHAISFVLASIFVRGWASKISQRALEMRLKRESEHNCANIEEHALARRMRQRRFVGLMVHRLRMTALALLLGFTGLGLIAWMLVPVGVFTFTLVMTLAYINSDARRDSSWPHIRQRFKNRIEQEWATVTSFGVAILGVAATAGATVAAFYLSNAILPMT